MLFYLYMNNINTFAALVESETIQRLHDEELDCEANLNNAKVKIVPGSKYAKVNVGGSGKFMVEIATGNIYGIKGYGQVNKGHAYGTLDTIANFFWGGYAPATKKV